MRMSYLLKSMLVTSAFGLGACGSDTTNIIKADSGEAPNAVVSYESSENESSEKKASFSIEVASGDSITFDASSSKDADTASDNLEFYWNGELGTSTYTYTAPELSSSNEILFWLKDDQDNLSEQIKIEVVVKKYATLNYLRKDGVYTDWGLHVWSNPECDGVATDTDWAKPLIAESISDEVGAVYKIELKADASCINYIIHKGDEKEIQNAGGANVTWQTKEGDTFYVSQGNNVPSTEKVALSIYDGQKAIFIDATTIAVPSALVKDSYTYELRYSQTAEIDFDDEKKSVTGGASAGTVSPTVLSAETIKKYPHLSDYTAFDVTLAGIELEALLKTQINFIVSNSEGDVFDATGFQLAPVIDATLADDVASTQLGSIVTGTDTTFKLWAPSAQSVSLYLYDESEMDSEGTERPMTEANGIWSSATIPDHVNKYYRYEVTVYHPQDNKIEVHEITDPYSLSLSTNSKFSQVVDLASDDLKPAGWDAQTIIELANPEQHTIYETHLRDLSGSDTEGTRELDGKYTAITETERASVKQLKALQVSGMNTIHLLNVFDIATVDENTNNRVDLDSTVEQFCAESVNPTAAVCSTDATGSLQSVLESYDPATGQAQALMNDLRMYDSFNWGYDPFHYTTPEGSYATDAEGTTRIKEYRKLIQTLHEMDFRVVMDVVYNHTNESGLSQKSVLDKIVPGYYQRLNASGGVESSTCCSNTATENTMMGKLMTDSLMVWAEQYKIDGFRFDLMGHQPKALMVDSLAKVKTIDPDNYFYGEGWNFGEVQNNARFVQASQYDMAGTGIGTYSDRLRDGIRGGSPFDSKESLRMNQGFANAAVWNEMVTDKGLPAAGETLAAGALSGEALARAELLNAADLIRLGMAGNLQNFILLDNKGETKRGKDIDYNGQKAGYTLDPQENVSYVSKHDNQTLWDNNMYKAATELSSAERAQMQIIALSAPMLGQGLPFFQLGSELLRSKSMQRDSYDSGDWFNAVKFDMTDNNWNIGLPRQDKDGDNWDLIKTIITDTNAKPTTSDIEWTDTRFKELLSIRTSSPLFSLATAAEVQTRVDFRNTGEDQVAGLIVMSIDDGAAVDNLDPANDALVVIINATNEEQVFSMPDVTGFTLHSAHQEVGASFDVVDTVGQFTVPALTTSVFVALEGATQGTGLPLSTKDLTDIPPLEHTPYVYVGADDNDAMTFISNGTYKVTRKLAVGDFEFKFADMDGANVFGFADATQTEGLALTDAADLFSLTVVKAGHYEFYINATDLDTVTVKVIESTELPAPYGETELFLRGSISDPDWGVVPAAQFTYIGNATYELEFEIAGGDVAMKIADAAWAAETNFGIEAPLVLDTALTLKIGEASGDVAVSLEAGTYLFSLDASAPTTPVVTVTAK